MNNNELGSITLEQLVSGNDNINHPKHYNVGKYEVIDVITDWDLDFCLGNAIKYIARSEHKLSEIDDLKKAVWYLNYKIQKLEGENVQD